MTVAALRGHRKGSPLLTDEELAQAAAWERQNAPPEERPDWGALGPRRGG